MGEVFNIFDANAQKNNSRDVDSLLLNTLSFDFESEFNKIIHDNPCQQREHEKKEEI